MNDAQLHLDDAIKLFHLGEINNCFNQQGRSLRPCKSKSVDKVSFTTLYLPRQSAILRGLHDPALPGCNEA